MTGPSSAETYERARRFANISMWTIALQVRRLRSNEPEDDEFIFRRWADYEFLIFALIRMRTAAALAAKIPCMSVPISEALNDFDACLPAVRSARNVLAHFDEYAIDRGHLKSIKRFELEVGFCDEKQLKWLDLELDTDLALAASEKLFGAIKQARATLP